MSHGRCVRSCYFALCLSLCFSVVLLRRVFRLVSCLGGYSHLVSCSGGYSRRFFVLSPAIFRGHTTFPFDPLLCLSLCFSAVLLRRVFRLVSCLGGYSHRFFVLSPAVFRGHTTFPFNPLRCLSLCFSVVLLRRVFRLVSCSGGYSRFVSCSGGYSRRFFVLSPAVFREHTTFPFDPLCDYADRAWNKLANQGNCRE